MTKIVIPLIILNISQMKKVLIVLSVFCISFNSCTTESDQTPKESNLNLEEHYVIYSFKGNTYRVNFTEDEEGNLNPVQDENYELVTSIFDKNDNLTQYYIDDNNIELFVDENVFSNFIESKKADSKLDQVDPYFFYVAGNMILYENCCYDSNYQFEWANTNCSYPDNTYNNYRRLKDFGNSSYWDGVDLPRCGQLRYLSNPNDKLSSIKVFNVAARLFEHKNYAGKSLFVEGRARFGKPNGGGIDRLKNVSFGFLSNWDNKTSSIQLYE